MIVRSLALHTGDRFEIAMNGERFKVQVVQLAKLESDLGIETASNALLVREDNGETITLESLSH